MHVTSYGAGLKDGKIKISDGTIFDIGAIVSAEGEPAQDEVEVKGDDELKATFISNIREELTIVANGVTFDVIEAITGNDVSSSATGMDIAMGTESQSNPPNVEVQAFTTAKTDDGTAATIKKVWHKVQIKSVKVAQAGEAEFNMELSGVALQTDEDIEGASLATKRVATLSVYTA